MKAIEFETVTNDGMLSIPSEYRDWNGKPVKVILRELPRNEKSDQTQGTFSAISLQTADYRFNRDVANER